MTPLIWAGAASSQTRQINPCLPFQYEAFRQMARDTWPIVTRNGFSEFGIGLDGLSVKIIPKDAPRRFGNCPTAAILDQLRISPDGRANGNIAQPSDEIPLQSDSARMFFDVDDLEDWSYQIPNERQMFGNFALRRDLRRAADGGTIMLRIQPQPLPPGWE